MYSYVGRFAPTPSGPLHLGSLVAALGSFLSARAVQGSWRLRIDDLDETRIMPGAESSIYRQLEAHGLTWDGVPYRQSEHLDQYKQALDYLKNIDRVYACRCTRSMLRNGSQTATGEPLYSGACRALNLGMTNNAIRVRVATRSVSFVDLLRGDLGCELETEVGDFVIRRRDGLFAYQLACAVDEPAMGITHVVRGADLISSSFRQIHLMELLRLAVPTYAHLPLMLDPAGRKLSKQNHAEALDPERASSNLVVALRHLGQRTPPDAKRWNPRDLVAFAIDHWDASQLRQNPH